MRYLLIVVFAALALGAVVLVVVAVSGKGGGPPVAFIAFWIAALAWNAYWWLGRVCVEVVVDGRELRWSTTLRSAATSLSNVVRVRPFRLGGQVAIIEVREYRNVLVPVRYGFERLVQALATDAPHVSIEER